MRIALLTPAATTLSGPAQFAAQLRASGHDVIAVTLATNQHTIDPCQLHGATLAFFQGLSLPSPWLVHGLTEATVSPACPSFHGLALLHHPLNWRRVLEREGVPVCPWLRVADDMSLERDPRVSVLGFPIRCVRAGAGSSHEAIVANDREELAAAARALAGPHGLLVERVPQGEVVSAFVGVAEGPLLFPAMDSGRATLTMGLARHVTQVLELAGPCRLTMVWEPGRLLLTEIALIDDLGPDSPAFRAAGGGYPAFVNAILQGARVPA